MRGRQWTQLNRNDKESQVLECSKRLQNEKEQSRAEKKSLVNFFFFFFFCKIHNMGEVNKAIKEQNSQRDWSAIPRQERIPR